MKQLLRRRFTCMSCIRRGIRSIGDGEKHDETAFTETAFMSFNRVPVCALDKQCEVPQTATAHGHTASALRCRVADIASKE